MNTLIALHYNDCQTHTFTKFSPFQEFKFPLSITVVHLVTKFVLAGLVRSCMTCKTGKARVTISWKPYVTKIAPPGKYWYFMNNVRKTSDHYCSLSHILSQLNACFGAFLSPPVRMHGGLICIGFCMSVTGPKFRLEKMLLDKKS